MRPIAMALLTLLSLTSLAFAQVDPAAPQATSWDAEHDPQPEPEQPLPASALEAFENALKRNADLLDALYGAMRVYNPSGDGKKYSMSLNNALDTDWIQQTPNVWGQSAGEVPLGAGRLSAIGGPNANPADIAMALALRSSKSTIRLSQQDLGSTDPGTGLLRFWWHVRPHYRSTASS